MILGERSSGCDCFALLGFSQPAFTNRRAVLVERESKRQGRVAVFSHMHMMVIPVRVLHVEIDSILAVGIGLEGESV